MAESEGPFAMVSGTSLNLPLHLRANGVFIQNLTVQWLQVAEAGFMPPNTSGSMGLNGTMVAIAKFVAPPGYSQPAAQANQTAFFTYTEAALPFVAGPTQGSAVAALATLERFTQASIPASALANAGRAIQLTDYNRGVRIDTGSVFWDIGHEVFDVKAFGALGDGITNDNTAFANAITALYAAGGGTLFIPRSSNPYIVTSIVIQDRTVPICIQGEGSGPESDTTAGGSWIRGPNAAAPIVLNIFSNIGSGSVANVMVRDLRITYDGGSSDTTGIQILNALYVTLENVVVYANGRPIDIQSSGNIVCNNVRAFIAQNPAVGRAALSIGDNAGAGVVSGPINFVGGQFGGGGSNGTPALRVTNTISTVFSGAFFSASGGGTGTHPVFIDGTNTQIEFCNCHMESIFNSNNDGAAYIIGNTTKPRHVGIYGGDYWGHGNGVNRMQDFARLVRCNSFVAIGVRVSRLGNAGGGFTRSMFRFEATALVAADVVFCGANDLNDITGQMYSDVNGVLPGAAFTGSFHFSDMYLGASHLASGQATAPTIGAPVANLGATMGVDSTDVRGTIILAPTAAIAQNTALMNLTFNRAMPKANHVAVVVAGNLAAEAIGFVAVNNGTGSFTLYNARAGLANAANYTVSYQVFG